MKYKTKTREKSISQSLRKNNIFDKSLVKPIGKKYKLTTLQNKEALLL